MQENFLKKKQVFRNKIELGRDKVGILGAGVTGLALAKFLDRKKIEYVLLDKTKPVVNIPFLSDSVNWEQVSDIAFFLKSPGIKPDHPLILQLNARNIPLLSEIEFASYFFSGKILGITGTDGKSTTTSLCFHILNHVLGNAKMGGNIGTPFIEFCEDDLEYAVLELSSYQLDDSEYVPVLSGAILNIAQDHLDRHKTMENYIQAKWKIVDPWNSHYTLVLNQRQKNLFTKRKQISGQTLYFGFSKEADGYIDIESKSIKTKNAVYSYINFPLEGAHNLENLAASILLVESVCKNYSQIQMAIETFQGLSHRFQKFHIWNGIQFINDSKSTNLHSMLSGLKGFSKKDRIVLILGGQPKIEDYEELFKRIEELNCFVLLFGDARDVWENDLQRILKDQYFSFDALPELVYFLKKLIHLNPVDHVIFSPAGASFDRYKNFEERGNHFMSLIKDNF